MKDDLLKGLFYLQDLSVDKYSEEVLTRFKDNLLPNLIAYIKSAENPSQEVFDSAKEIFG